MFRRLVLLTAACAAVSCVSKSKSGLPPEKERVQDTIATHVGDVSDCYTAALRRNPRLNGKLILDWEINALGDAKEIKIVQGLERKMDQCIVGKVEEWAFVPPPDGKVAKVRYPFIFSPPTAPEKPKSASCVRLEADYASLDGNKTGEMLDLIRSSPRLELSYLADLDRMLKSPKMGGHEVEVLMAKLSEDCWTSIHMRMWDSIFRGPKQAEAKEVLGQRLNLDVPSPTLLALSQDLAVIQKAVDAGVLKISENSKKDFDFLRAQAKNLRKTINSDWGVKEGDIPMASDVASDPEKIVPLVRKELKAVKPLRAQLKYWVRKYWKEL